MAAQPFGPYLLLERLGVGGMGEVWLARSRVRGAERDCVIKLIKDELVVDREAVGRFVDEVRVAVHLQHKNIAGALDMGRVGGRHYLALDYVDGVDGRAVLAEAIGRATPVPAAIAVAIIVDVLAGLAAAHAATDPNTGRSLGVVHRDVSPHNVLIGFDGVARVIDFGLATSTLKREQTEPHVVMGKAAYMAPEQCQGARVDGSVDVFAAAVVLYELLRGRRFYGAASGVALYQRAARGGYVPDDVDATGALAPLLRQAWGPVGTRPSAAAFAEALTRALPPARPAEVAAWLRTQFPDAKAASMARAARIAAAVASDDTTEAHAHRSLLDGEAVRSDDNDDNDDNDGDVRAPVLYQAPGVWGLARVPAPGVVHVVLRGHGDEAAGAWQRAQVDQELLRRPDARPVQFFSDVEHLTTHDAIFRQQMTAWQGRVKDRVSQLVLFRSQLVVVAITIANKLSGGGTEVTSSRTRFETELKAAVAARR